MHPLTTHQVQLYIERIEVQRNTIAHIAHLAHIEQLYIYAYRKKKIKINGTCQSMVRALAHMSKKPTIKSAAF